MDVDHLERARPMVAEGVRRVGWNHEYSPAKRAPSASQARGSMSVYAVLGSSVSFTLPCHQSGARGSRQAPGPRDKPQQRTLARTDGAIAGQAAVNVALDLKADASAMTAADVCGHDVRPVEVGSGPFRSVHDEPPHRISTWDRDFRGSFRPWGGATRRACCHPGRAHRPDSARRTALPVGRAAPQSTCHRGQRPRRETRGPAQASRT